MPSRITVPEIPLASFSALTEVPYFAAMVYRESPGLTVWWVLPVLLLDAVLLAPDLDFDVVLAD